MKYQSIVTVSAGLVGSVGATDACIADDITTDWYKDLVYCANGASESLDLTALHTCVASLVDTEDVIPAADTALTTVLSTANDCSSCMLQFANGAYDLKWEFAADCLYSIGTSGSLPKINESACIGLLYDAIDLVNECMTTAGEIDLVTATTSVRCTSEDFVEIDRVYRPWADIAIAGSALYPPNDLTISVAFDAAVGAVGCSSCFENLYSALLSFNTNCHATPYSAACLTDTADAREAFGVCSGGHALNVVEPTKCTAQEWKLLDTVYRPYDGYVMCSSLWAGTEARTSFDECVSDYSGIERSPTSDCDVCYDDLVESVRDLYPTFHCGTPTDAICSDYLSQVGGPLNEFAVCTGFEMDITSTACTADETLALASGFKSYIPLFIEAKYATTQFLAGDLIDDMEVLMDLLEAVDDLNCASCFRAFTADLYYWYTNTPVVALECRNPYSYGCAEALSVILNRFTECSGGMVLTSDSIYTCSEDEYLVLIDAGINESLWASTTGAVDAAAATAEMVTFLSDPDVTALLLASFCWPCYTELLHATLALSNTARVACADVESAECVAALSEELDAFAECSGSVFVRSGEVPTWEETTTTEEISTTSNSAAFTRSIALAAASLFVAIL